MILPATDTILILARIMASAAAVGAGIGLCNKRSEPRGEGTPGWFGYVRAAVGGAVIIPAGSLLLLLACYGALLALQWLPLPDIAHCVVK